MIPNVPVSPNVHVKRDDSINDRETSFGLASEIVACTCILRVL